MKQTITAAIVTMLFSVPLAADTATNPWDEVSGLEDPTKKLVDQFRRNLKSAEPVKPTGITRKDYLKLIAGNVDCFKRHQDQHGAIIDPCSGKEKHFATPCFALAAAALIAHANRPDLVPAAAAAMDSACRTLSRRLAPTAHEDFFTIQLAHALPLMKPHVPEVRYRQWEADLRQMDPFKVYRSAVGGGNWNVVALSGEYLLHKLGIREDLTFVERSLEAQGKLFVSPWGQYLEGHMAYDVFPRIWAADMLDAGYTGARSKELAEMLRRGALTSLFMQSPRGELPVGGRSAQHQWNEAEQVMMFEISAKQAKNNGDADLAAAFKRAAHLSFADMKKWQRSTGELFIVKNRVDPAKRHGFEGYSEHSVYNLLATAMLAIAWEHAESSEVVNEGPAPADVGGFVFRVGDRMHKIVANADGMYIEIDPTADHHYDATGLLRVHSQGVDPQIGPGESLTNKARTNLPKETSTTAAIGPQWPAADGTRVRLAQTSSSASNVSMTRISESTERVSFVLLYGGPLPAASSVTESYVVTPAQVEIATEVHGTSGSTQMVWPVFANNGETTTRIELNSKTVAVSWNGREGQTFNAPNATSVTVGDTLYPHRTGWSRLATAEYPLGEPMKLVIKPQTPQAESKKAGKP